MKRTKIYKRRRMSLMGWIVFAVLVLYAISMCLVVLWGVFTALKSQSEFLHDKVWLPDGWPWEWCWSNITFVLQNYYIRVTSSTVGTKEVWLETMVLNSVLYAGGSALMTLVATCWTAYLTAKFKYFFSKVIYVIVIITLALPIVGSDPSMLQLMQSLNLYDTFIGSWLQKFKFLGIYFLVFYAVFASLPKDYFEAAYVDGASELTLFFRVALPLVVNISFTVFLLEFVTYWNDYQTPLLYLPTHPTLAYGVYALSNTRIQGFNYVPIRMACSVIVVIPIFILFLIFKKRMMRNVSMGGLKE